MSIFVGKFLKYVSFWVIGCGVVFLFSFFFGVPYAVGQAGGSVLSGTVSAPIPSGSAQSKAVVISSVTTGAIVKYRMMGGTTCNPSTYSSGSEEADVPLYGGVGFVLLADEGDNEKILCFQITKVGETPVYVGSSAISGIDVTDPLAPTLLDLHQVDDSGLLHNDDVTNETENLNFTGCAESGATVRLYDDGVMINGATAVASRGTCTNGTDTDGKLFSILANLPSRERAYMITAVASDVATNNSRASDMLSVVVDGVAPTVDVLSVSDGYVSSVDKEDAVPVPIFVSGSGDLARVSLTVRDSDPATPAVVKSDVADIVYDLRGLVSDGKEHLAAVHLSDDDAFGSAIAVSGSRVYVGAPGDATGGTDSGAVYVFNDMNGDGDYLEGGEAWVIDAHTAGLSLSMGDSFGSAIAVSADGSRLYVGAPGDHTGGPDRGAVYVLEDMNGDGDYAETGEVVKISDRTHGIALADDDSFGSAVAVGGDVLVVGSRESSVGGLYRGAVHILRDRDGDNEYDGAGEVLVLDSTHAGLTLDNRDHFGSAVAVSGSKIFVGAPGTDTTTAANVGKVYVFEDRNDDGDYGDSYEITAIDGQTLGTQLVAGGLFGSSFSITGSRLYVGAQEHGGGGAVYVLEDRNGDGDYDERGDVVKLDGHHEDILLGSSDLFGAAVVSDGLTVYIGAPGDDAGGGEHGAMYVLDGAFSASLSPTEIQGLTKGTITVTAVGEDIAGNVSDADSVSFVYTTAVFQISNFGIDFADEDDTGSSATDNKTRQTENLTFSGTLTGPEVDGAYVQLYRDGVAIYGAVDRSFDLSRGWSVDVALRANRTYKIGMKLLSRTGTVLGSAAMMVEVYTAAPTNSPGTFSIKGQTGGSGNMSRGGSVVLAGATDGAAVSVGDYVALYSGETLLGSGYVFASDDRNGGTAWEVAVSGSSLGTGTHTITAKYFSVYGNASDATTSYVLTVR